MNDEWTVSLGKVRWSDTIRQIRRKLCDKLGDDELMNCKEHWLGLPDEEPLYDDDNTLASFFDLNPSGSTSDTITLHYTPLLSYLHKLNAPPKTCLEEVDPTYLDDDDGEIHSTDSEDNNVVISSKPKVHHDPFGYERRPLVLPQESAGPSLHISGDLEVYTKNGGYFEASSFSCGLPYGFQIGDISRMLTDEEVVLLVPTVNIWEMLMDFFFLQSPECEDLPYLKVLVQWDKHSYLFLRKLKDSMSPDVQFVVCTDTLNYHLDLATFLDTPPEDVKEYYGWDLGEDCERANVSHVKKLDIKWVGLRPLEVSRIQRCKFNWDWYYISCCEYMVDFEVFNAELMRNPHFRAKKEWVSELKELKRQPGLMYRPFHDLQPLFNVDKKFLARKLLGCDWI